MRGAERQSTTVRVESASAVARAARRSPLERVAEWLLPDGARLRGGYFAGGVERAVCRALHEAARRQTLYRFAPPPPLRLACGGGAAHVDEYCFRSPFVSHVAARNHASVRLHHSGADVRVLVILNLATTSRARRRVERTLLDALLAAGVDVAVPVAPGTGSRQGAEDRRRGWAHTVGAALSAIVQLVHDNVALEAWARGRGYRTVVAGGVGIGGAVTALLAATTTRFDAYVPICAGAHPGRVWMPPRPLARAVHTRALAAGGVRARGTLVRLFDPGAPIRLRSPRDPQRCTIVGLRLDAIVRPQDVRDLAEHWRVEPRWIGRARSELPRCAPELADILAHAARDARG